MESAGGIPLSTALGSADVAETPRKKFDWTEKGCRKRTAQDMMSEAAGDPSMDKCGDSSQHGVCIISRNCDQTENSNITITGQGMLSGSEVKSSECGAQQGVGEDDEGVQQVLLSGVRDAVTCDKLLQKIKYLEEENIRLKEENLTMKTNTPDPETKLYSYSEIEKIFESTFSKTQISAVINKNDVKQWSDEDISEAFTLRSISPKCYEYLKTKKGIPLPSAATLTELAKNFECEPGLLKSVLSFMKKKCDTYSLLEKLTVMSIGEMPIKGEMCYDQGQDCVIQPHDTVQCIMLRGLVGKWEHIVLYEYDVSFTDKSLLTLIEMVEQAGYPVIAIVHDLEFDNLSLWKEFGIDVAKKKVSIQNPSAEREIFMFADAPHLLKSIRNYFLDSGFYLKDGNFISGSSVREMLTARKAEYGLGVKVGSFHLNVRGEERQRVDYAAELMSKTCSRSLIYLGEKGLLQSKGWRETAEFISLVDDWFDVMNSCNKLDEKQSLNAFGMNISDQESVLHKMIEVMTTMRVKDPSFKDLYKFQKGVILSSLSLIGLYKMLQKSFDLDFILTRNLNQECLDHLFGCIKEKHGTSNPNALTFKFTLKKLLLTKCVTQSSEKSDTTDTSQADDEGSPFVDNWVDDDIRTRCFNYFDIDYDPQYEFDDFTPGFNQFLKMQKKSRVAEFLKMQKESQVADSDECITDSNESSEDEVEVEPNLITPLDFMKYSSKPDSDESSEDEVEVEPNLITPLDFMKYFSKLDSKECGTDCDEC